MKSAFPILSNYTQTLLGSHLADWNQRVAPALPRLQLLPNCHLKQKPFNAVYFHSDFIAIQILL